MRKAAAARLAETLVLPLRRLPPETFVPGLRASQAAKCFSLAQALLSVPVSESTASPVLSPIPLISVRSTPVRLYWSVRASYARPFLLSRFGLRAAGRGPASPPSPPSPPSTRSHRP